MQKFFKCLFCDKEKKLVPESVLNELLEWCQSHRRVERNKNGKVDEVVWDKVTFKHLDEMIRKIKNSI